MGWYGGVHSRSWLYLMEGSVDHRVSMRTQYQDVYIANHLMAFVVFGPSILSLLLWVLWQHGTFSCLLLHTLVRQSRVASSLNTMVSFLSFGAMRTFGCSLSWYHSFAICVISCGNSKCLPHPITCERHFTYTLISFFQCQTHVHAPSLPLCSRNSKVQPSRLSTKNGSIPPSRQQSTTDTTSQAQSRLCILTKRQRSKQDYSCLRHHHSETPRLIVVFIT